MVLVGLGFIDDENIHVNMYMYMCNRKLDASLGVDQEKVRMPNVLLVLLQISETAGVGGKSSHT